MARATFTLRAAGSMAAVALGVLCLLLAHEAQAANGEDHSTVGSAAAGQTTAQLFGLPVGHTMSNCDRITPSPRQPGGRCGTTACPCANVAFNAYCNLVSDIALVGHDSAGRPAS
jgi:hypothetical protein